MSEFREFIQETKSSLLDLDVLLQRAKSKTTVPSERTASSPEPHHSPFDAIISAIEGLSKRLREREALQQTERRNLHLQMERVRVKIERVVDHLEAALRSRPEYVSEGEQQQDVSRKNDDARVKMDSLSVDEYVSQGEILLQSDQYEACLELMTLALAEHPDIEAIHNLAHECRRQLENQQLQEEMVVHLDNLKKEAMDQFDREQFEQCVNTFAFLCELEPENQTLQDYLKLSRQQVLETQGTALPDQGSALQLTTVNTMQIHEAISVPVDFSSEPPESSDDLEITALNQKKDVDGEDPYQAKSLNETAADRPSVQDWSPGLTDWKTLCAAGSVMALALMLGAEKFLKMEAGLGGTVVVRSEPPDSTAFVNGIARGQTPLRLQGLELGIYNIRIEKDGHLSYCSKITLEGHQPNVVSAQLETWPLPPISENSPSLGIKSLAVDGDLVEQLEICESILKVSPKNPAVRTLQASVRHQLFEQIDEAVKAGRWRAAQDKLSAVLRISPADRTARERLRLVQTKVQSHLTAPRNAGASGNVQIEELQQRISSAIASSNYFPPGSGNALELIRNLKRIVPESSFAEEKLGLIREKTAGQARVMIEVGDVEGARTLVHQLNTYFPDYSQLAAVTERLKSQEAAIAQVNTTVAKAEAALASGHFIVPFDESAFSLSNRALKLAPNHQRAQSVRRESVSRALVEAKGWTADGKYDESRQVYFTVSQILGTGTDLPFSAREITNQLERLEFVALPVTHHHALGSCTGTLKFRLRDCFRANRRL